jgi:hypothetical protein
MKKEINIVLKAPIENLQDDLKAMLGEFAKTGKGIDKEMGATLASVEEALGKIATSKNTSRAVKQLQNLALTVQELGPEFEGMAQKIIQEAGGIKDAVGDVGAQIDYFASDTRKFDAVLSGVQGLAGGFEVVQGTMALLGDENEDLQKTMTKLMATMSIVQGLQEVQNVLQKESTFMVGLQTAAQKALAIQTYATASAMNAMKVALAATGIGLAVVGITLLASKMMEAKEKSKKAAEEQQKYADELDKSRESIIKQSMSLESYFKVVSNTSKSEKVREEALKKINELGVETTGINIKNAESLNQLRGRIDAVVLALQKKAIAESFDNQVADAAIKLSKVKSMASGLEAVALNNLNNAYAQGVSVGKMQQNLDETKKRNIKAVSSAEKELTDIIKLQQGAVEEYMDAQSKVFVADKQIGKSKVKTSEKTLDQLEKEYKANEDLKRQKEEANAFKGQTLAGSQPLSPLQQLSTDIQQDNQIQLTNVIESETEKQRNAFAMTAEEYRDFQNQMATANENIQNSFRTMVADVAVSFGVLVGELITGENGFQNFMKSFIYSVSDFLMALGKSLIAAGIAMTSFYEFLVSNPVLAVGAGIAAVAASVAVKNIADRGIAFADGGIVSGPTLGLVGEYANASTNPEVIAPLDKLKSIIGSPGDGGGQSGYIAETRISGRDLAIILKREKEGATRG